MQPFDKRIPEEEQQENKALIAFFRQAYRSPAAVTADEGEQVLARVRERLLHYDETEMPGIQTFPLSPVEREVTDVRSNESRSLFSMRRGRKRNVWGRSMRMITAAAIVILLVGSTAFLLQSAWQNKNGGGNRTSWPVLATFEGTGSKTLSNLNLALPTGRGVGVDLSCDGPGNGSVALYNKYPLLADSGLDDWRHPTILNFNFSSCSILNSGSRGYEMGITGGTYTLHEVQVSVDPATSWKLKIVSFPLSPTPNVPVPALSLPKNQVPLGEFAGTGGTILVPPAYALPIDFHPDQPWQLYLVCRGPGKVDVALDLGKTYQLSSEYQYQLPSEVTYTVPCGESAPVSVSQLFPPSLNAASETVGVDVSADPDVNWHWILGRCIDSSSSGCQPLHEKP